MEIKTLISNLYISERYPKLTEEQVDALIAAHGLGLVEPAHVQLELLKIADFYSRKPSKAKSPSTFMAVANWFSRVNWKRVPTNDLSSKGRGEFFGGHDI